MDISRHDGLRYTAPSSCLRAIGHNSLFAHDGFILPRYSAVSSRSPPQDPLLQHAGWQSTGGITMQLSTFRNLLKLCAIASVALLALPARADDDRRRVQALVQLPSGQYITPTA